MNIADPTPPPGLTTAQSFRWRTAHRHLASAGQTDINALDEAGRTRHYARLQATIDDLLRLIRELSKPGSSPLKGESDVF